MLPLQISLDDTALVAVINTQGTRITDLLLHIERMIAMNHDELTAALQAAADKTDKIIAEVKASTAQLEAAIAAAGNTTPELDAALARLQASLTVADDLNPDAPAPAPAPDPAP